MTKMRFPFAFSALLLGAVSANAGTVYLDDNLGNLWAGDPTTATYQLVGNTISASGTGVLPGDFSGFTDIDFVGSILYGLDSHGTLYSIDLTTAAATAVGTGGVTDGSLVGLAGNSSGVLYAGGTSQVYTVDTATGATTLVGDNSGAAYQVEGDLEFIGANLYLTSTGGDGGEFFSVDPDTGFAIDIGPTSFSSVFGLAYDSENGTLYGFDVGGTQFDIDPATGLGGDEVVFSGVTDDGGLLGAAFIADTPEPSTFVLLGSTLLGIGAIRRRSAANKA